MHKILSVGTVLVITLSSVCLHAQSINKKSNNPAKKKNISFSVGLQSGRELLFNSSPLLHSRQSKVHYGLSNRLVLRKPLTTHIQLETGLNSTAFQTGFGNNPYVYKPLKKDLFSAPITAQYYFLPGKCRCRPSIGAGLQYNINPAASQISLFNPEIPSQNQNYQTGTKYISVLFTQGMTFEVNTKIEINESFHFIPNNPNSNTIGIDMGIGYKFR